MNFTIRREFVEAAACALYGVDPSALPERLDGLAVNGWWFAYDSGSTPRGLALAAERADGRVFVTHRLVDEAAYEPLLAAAAAEIDGAIYVTVTEEQPARRAAAFTLGMREELVIAQFDVPFDQAIASLPPRPRSSRYRLVSAAVVDHQALYELDVELRGDVPGSDGWRGVRSWFDDEMTADEFDPTGYSVAVDPSSGQLVGLCRMWRNADGPSLGMLGVRPEARTGVVALELLQQTLTGATSWGWSTFRTHTARPALQRRLERMGAARSGGFTRFVRPYLRLSVDDCGTPGR